jgi:toxin ParE1/3/4
VTDIVLTHSAHRDLTRILAEIHTNAGIASAHKYDAEFSRTFARLMQFPDSGAPRPRLGVNTRLSVVYPYLIYYRRSAAADIVLIMRILHGRREITRGMLER